MTQLGKFLKLPPEDRRLLTRAIVLHAGIRLGLRLLPVPILRRMLAEKGCAAPARERPSDLREVERITWAVGVASRVRPVTGTCLSQALAVQVLLGRKGYPARLRIGVARREGEGLQAHAWVESHDGRIVMGGTEASLTPYTPLPVFEGKRP